MAESVYFEMDFEGLSEFFERVKRMEPHEREKFRFRVTPYVGWGQPGLSCFGQGQQPPPGSFPFSSGHELFSQFFSGPPMRPISGRSDLLPIRSEWPSTLTSMFESEYKRTTKWESSGFPSESVEYQEKTIEELMSRNKSQPSFNANRMDYSGQGQGNQGQSQCQGIFGNTTGPSTQNAFGTPTPARRTNRSGTFGIASPTHGCYGSCCEETSGNNNASMGGLGGRSRKQSHDETQTSLQFSFSNPSSGQESFRQFLERHRKPANPSANKEKGKQ